MKAKDVELQPKENSYQESSVFGKRFANAGGVTNAVLQYMKETDQEIDATVFKANGAAECKKGLLLMKVGRFQDDFMEGMICEGGCVGGPSSYEEHLKAKKSRDKLIDEADDRTIVGNLKNYAMDSFSMHRAHEEEK